MKVLTILFGILIAVMAIAILIGLACLILFPSIINGDFDDNNNN